MSLSGIGNAAFTSTSVQSQRCSRIVSSINAKNGNKSEYHLIVGDFSMIRLAND